MGSASGADEDLKIKVSFFSTGQRFSGHEWGLFFPLINCLFSLFTYLMVEEVNISKIHFNGAEVKQNQHGQSDFGEVKEHVYNLLLNTYIFSFMDHDVIIGLPIKYINHSAQLLELVWCEFSCDKVFLLDDSDFRSVPRLGWGGGGVLCHFCDGFSHNNLHLSKQQKHRKQIIPAERPRSLSLFGFWKRRRHFWIQKPSKAEVTEQGSGPPGPQHWICFWHLNFNETLNWCNYTSTREQRNLRVQRGTGGHLMSRGQRQSGGPPASLLWASCNTTACVMSFRIH